MNTNIKFLIGIILLILVGLFIFNAFVKDSYVNEPAVVIEEKESEEAIPSEFAIEAPEQAAGDSIYVERAVIADKRGGFVVIRRESTPDDAASTTEPKQGGPGEIIGVSDLLPPGVHERMVIRLNEGETVSVDEYVYAILYTDNGDGVFDPAIDHEAQGGVTRAYIHIVDQGALENETKL